jgi:four helix bundle protein
MMKPLFLPPHFMADSAVLTPPTASTKEAKKHSSAALEERTLQFAAATRKFLRKMPHASGFHEEAYELLRSTSSVGISYIEANEADGKGEFEMRIRECLKASKESSFWLRLIDTGNSKSLKEAREELVQESKELIRIFFAILRSLRTKKA